MSTNLDLKKFQIVKDVADREEFLKLCKPFVGYDKSLTVDVSRGFTDSIVVKLKIKNEDEMFSHEIKCLARINDTLRVCDVSVHLQDVFTHNELYEILMIQSLLENQIEVYLSKLHEQSAANKDNGE